MIPFNPGPIQNTTYNSTLSIHMISFNPEPIWNTTFNSTSYTEYYSTQGLYGTLLKHYITHIENTIQNLGPYGMIIKNPEFSFNFGLILYMYTISNLADKVDDVQKHNILCILDINVTRNRIKEISGFNSNKLQSMLDSVSTN